MQILRAARGWSGPSPSVFAGRKLVTTYERNAAGQVVRAVMEPEFTAEDREAVYALQVYEAGLCGGCGHPLAETTDPANEDAYLPQLPIRCWRCTASGQGAERYENVPQPQALMVPIVHRKDLPSPVPGEADPAREPAPPSTSE